MIHLLSTKKFVPGLFIGGWITRCPVARNHAYEIVSLLFNTNQKYGMFYTFILSVTWSIKKSIGYLPKNPSQSPSLPPTASCTASRVSLLVNVFTGIVNETSIARFDSIFRNKTIILM